MRKRERKIETEQRLNGTRTTATLTMTSDDVSARDDKRRREALSTANDAKRSSNGNLVQKCRTTTYPPNGGRRPGNEPLLLPLRAYSALENTSEVFFYDTF